MTLRQEAYAMIDSLPDDDSVKFFIDMIRRFNVVAGKTEEISENQNLFSEKRQVFLHMEELKKQGLWFVCADMGGESMYKLNLRGPIGLVIGNEGEGVGSRVKETCDMVASIPMKGQIDSLNASVAAGVLAYEIVRQRLLPS